MTSTGGSWTAGSCTKIMCPIFTIAQTHPTCACATGFSGNSVWDGHDWDVDADGTCRTASCPDNAEHVHPIGGVCKCMPGYTDEDSALTWDIEGGKWTGSCVKVPCPANAQDDHPTCTCPAGFFGSPKWNAAAKAFDGTCDPAKCPAGAAGDEGADCACATGYQSDPLAGPVWHATLGWTHTCSCTSEYRFK
jgi:hypothetical protein